MSIRIKDVPPKTAAFTATTKLVTEDPNDETNKTKGVLLSNLPILTYAASDEDAPLSVGILYTTEAAILQRTIKNIIATLKNTPTGSSITIDIQKETGVNTNSFATILSTLLTININDFTSQTATVPVVVSDDTWEAERRIQIILTTTDTNFAATGLKVTLAS